ncbi:MAG: RNA methyltransferase [Desulfobacterales bacterium]|nr:RNA methyltransferase [Desulfobacterales bacterium]
MALLHYPVVNKNGEPVASAVTNLDLHDISRAARTYGVRGFHVVTPLKDQRALVEKLLRHWRSGAGARLNPKRGEALSLIRLSESLEEVTAHISRAYGEPPVTVATTARGALADLTFPALREKLLIDRPHLLLLGTAWGLAEEILLQTDFVLAPIRGDSDYNHLSVRSAASVMMDRLLAPSENPGTASDEVMGYG